MEHHVTDLNNIIPKQVVLENRACPFGCARRDEVVVIGKDRIYGVAGEFQVVRCCTCGLLRTNPRPTIDTIGYYYPDNYHPHISTLASQNDIPAWKQWISRMLPLNVENIPPVRPGYMVELGCASGSFLHLMANKGWQVEGIEPSRIAATAAQTLGYPIHIGPVETAPDPQQQCDLVIGWMVLEHLHEPRLVLEKLRRWTRPGGWLVLSVPNAASLEFRVFRDAWFALQLPTHLYHFTPETIRHLLTICGWRVEKIFHQRMLGNLFSSIGYKLREKGSETALVDWLIGYPENGPMQYVFFPLAWLLSMSGQTGRMTIWAQQPQ